jgi:hypothetical protein
MDLSAKQRVRLEPADEYMHPVEAHVNFNESMYINAFDPQQRIGGWFRVGNRPNEGHSEVSVCLYLPGGQVGFMYRRPSLDHHRELNAGGLRFEIIEPFRRLRVTYDGDLCLLDNPAEMADPKRAFADNPRVHANITLTFEGVSPMYGGEALDENGAPVQESPEEAFARAHYEQHVAATGSFVVGDREWQVNGFGLRDHSWGPRYWQNLYWYRWLPMNFGRDFAMNISIVTLRSGRQHIWGMVLQDGRYDLIETAELVTEYDADDVPLGWRATVSTDRGRYEVEGRVISQIPLRNRRVRDDGVAVQTRIIEGFTEVHCRGLTGFGMSEYLDQVDAGRIVGRHC